MSGFTCKSKTIPVSALEEVVTRLIPLGLKDVGVNVRGEFRKRDSGFMVSLTPKNSYYTNCAHITNDDFDPLFDAESVMGKFRAEEDRLESNRPNYEDDVEPHVMLERGELDLMEDIVVDPPMREALHGSEVVKLAIARGASIIHFTVTDAMIRLEFEVPSAERNWGLKKGCVAEPWFIETQKRSDRDHSILNLI